MRPQRAADFPVVDTSGRPVDTAANAVDTSASATAAAVRAWDAMIITGDSWGSAVVGKRRRAESVGAWMAERRECGEETQEAEVEAQEGETRCPKGGGTSSGGNADGDNAERKCTVGDACMPPVPCGVGAVASQHMADRSPSATGPSLRRTLTLVRFIELLVTRGCGGGE
ncbi:unnamed protein product [Closterium sp. NIES-64]|nr:unnamed protein product [Closterium sp. NIES-64]